MPAEYRLSVRDGDRVREVVLVGTVTVGRLLSCEISSADPRLSRAHATFEVVGGDVVVRDLGSGNGTRVNGAPITEHRLTTADQVEVGPFIVQVIAGAVHRRPTPGPLAEDATVMMLERPAGAAAAPAETPPAPAASDVDESEDRTRMIRRSDVPVSVAEVIAAPRDTSPRTERRPPPAKPSPHRVPAQSASQATLPPQPTERPPAAAPTARPAPTELTFANAALLWIVPIVLISFLAGLIPAFMQPDERAQLLRAHYLSLAASAVDLVTLSREPAAPLDNVTTALRRQAGVTGARVIGADGRVLAPLDQAGTTVPPPVAPSVATLSRADGPAITESGAFVEVRVPTRTADGRPVLIALTVDPERIHPAPPGSALATLLLILSLGAAWLVARHLTTITNARLSRLGEEIELMTTKQISVGREPFGLTGGRRILDAVTFALSAVGRIGSGSSPALPPVAVQSGERSATALIDVDAAFRIVTADRGCEGLLGINAGTVVGAHLIDALPDQAVSNEVMRLVTVATPDGVASGEVTSESGVQLGIEVTKGGGDAPLSIRFRRL